MVMKKLLTATVIFCSCFSFSAAWAAIRQSEDKPCTVRKIYIADLGSSADAIEFRRALGKQLAKKGFTVVERAEEAEAILSATLSITQDGNATEVKFEKGTLKTPAGEQIWHGNFYETSKHHAFSFFDGNSLDSMAGHITSNLRARCR